MITFAQLVEYCRRDGWPVQAEEDKHRIRTRFGGRNGSYTVTMSVDEERQAVLLLAPYYLRADPADVADEVRLRLLELLLYINYEILYGNFEYDIRDGEVRYRLSFPCEGTEFAFTTFVRCTKAMMWACDYYYPACQRVLWGGMNARQAIDSLSSDDDDGGSDDHSGGDGEDRTGGGRDPELDYL